MKLVSGLSATPARKVSFTDQTGAFVVRLRDGSDRPFVGYDFSDVQAGGRFVFIGTDHGLFELTTREIEAIDFGGRPQ